MSSSVLPTYWNKSSKEPQRWLREYLSYEERLRELGLFTLQKAQGGILSICINRGV